MPKKISKHENVTHASVKMAESLMNKDIQIKKLHKLYQDEEFKKKLHVVKINLALGKTLAEARHLLPELPSNAEWNLIVKALGTFTVNPEKLAIEHFTRNKVRVEQASQLYKNAMDKGNLRAATAALMVLIKLDEAFIQIPQALGLIKLEAKDVGELGEGIDANESKARIEEYERNLFERVRQAESYNQSVSLLPGGTTQDQRPDDNVQDVSVVGTDTP